MFPSISSLFLHWNLGGSQSL